jgi:hypothetical protein
MNNERDGRTIQKMLVESWETFSMLDVSMYSQIMAKTDTMGNDAKTPAAREYLFEISEMVTIRRAEIATFKT